MRRLDLHPAKRLRGARRHARAFHAAMDRLDALTPPQSGERYANFKVPAAQKALSPRHGDPAFRRDVVARLIASADRMARRTPARVAALIDWPDLFGSEVWVFFDAASAQAWDPRHRAAEPRPARTEWTDGWVEARVPAHDLLADLGLDVPEGFAAHGTELVEYDRDTDIVTTREEWVVMDIRFPVERSLP